MSYSERVLVLTSLIFICAIVINSVEAMRPVDMFYNQCHYKINDFVCHFDWHRAARWAVEILFGYTVIVIVGSNDILRNPRGGSDG